MLIPRARAGNQELVRRLKEAGARVLDLPIYDTEYESFPWMDCEREFETGNCWAMFTSASTVRGFVRTAGELDQSKVTAMCIGEMTAGEAKRAGMRTFTAARATLRDLVNLALQMAAEEREDGEGQSNPDGEK